MTYHLKHPKGLLALRLNVEDAGARFGTISVVALRNPWWSAPPTIGKRSIRSASVRGLKDPDTGSSSSGAELFPVENKDHRRLSPSENKVRTCIGRRSSLIQMFSALYQMSVLIRSSYLGCHGNSPSYR